MSRLSREKTYYDIISMTIALCALAVIFCSAGYAAEAPAQGKSFQDYLCYVCKMRDEFGVKSDAILGLDKRVFFGGSLSDDNYSAKVCIEDRKFLNEPLTLGLEAQNALLDDKRYRQATNAGGVYIYTTAIGEYTKLGAEFKYSQPDIYHLRGTVDPAIRRYEGKNQVSTLLFKWENFPVDNEDYPKSGRKSNLNFGVSSKALGSDFDFLRLTAQNALYYTPAGDIFGQAPLHDITFVLNGQAGWMEGFDGRDEIPFFEKFYAGGTNNVRGYRARYLAPRDIENLPIGGRCMAVFNVEMRYPLYEDIKGAVFYDQGNAWSKPSGINLADTKSGIGTGLRWVTPLGVARLDYGFGLNSGARQKGGRAHISLGMKF